MGTTVVCLITSNLTRANAPGNVLLTQGEAGLLRTSVVNVSQIVTVDKAELIEYVGHLNAVSAAAVRDGLHLLFERL
jgi:mRNA interferase MazF